MDWSLVEDAVGSVSTGITVGVSILAPDGSRWSHNGSRKFHAASTVKVPLMVEIYRQVERGERSLDEIHVLRDKARGSGVLLHMHEGLEVTLRDLVYLMISISDNTATNMLIRLATMDAVNQLMPELGMTGSNLDREMKGRAPDGGEAENWATPDDYVAVIRSILDGRAASRESCDQMIAMLELQQNRRRLARYLPVDDAIRWGSKTGTIPGVVNDVGFITSPAGTLVLAVYCDGLSSFVPGEKIIGDISRAAMLATGIVEPLPVG